MAGNINPIPPHYFTLEEYFALESASDRRYEYGDGEIVCMSGGTIAHGQISRHLLAALFNKLDGKPCQVFTGDLAIKTPLLGNYRYPNASVVCGEVQSEKINGMDMLINPAVIVEVLSPTSERRDRNEKRRADQAIPSLREDLIVSQELPLTLKRARRGGATTRRRSSARPSESS